MNADKPMPIGFDEVAAGENAVRLVNAILGLGPGFAFAAKLKELSNYELSGLLIDHVWAYLPADKPQSQLLDVVIERLKGNIKDDTCPDCGGSGRRKDGHDAVDCPRCHGHGVVVVRP